MTSAALQWVSRQTGNPESAASIARIADALPVAPVAKLATLLLAYITLARQGDAPADIALSLLEVGNEILEEEWS